VFSTSNNYLVI